MSDGLWTTIEVCVHSSHGYKYRVYEVDEGMVGVEYTEEGRDTKWEGVMSIPVVDLPKVIEAMQIVRDHINKEGEIR